MFCCYRWVLCRVGVVRDVLIYSRSEQMQMSLYSHHDSCCSSASGTMALAPVCQSHGLLWHRKTFRLPLRVHLRELEGSDGPEVATRSPEAPLHPITPKRCSEVRQLATYPSPCMLYPLGPCPPSTRREPLASLPLVHPIAPYT